MAGLSNTTQYLSIEPMAAAMPSETHSALVLTQNAYSGDLLYCGSVCTAAQLREGSAANPWETAWLVWDYTDNDHFYYFALKTNGWELGKRDPSYEGGQRFLQTGSNATFSLGTWHDFKVVQVGDEISVTVDGVTLVSFKDTSSPYRGGRLGIYSEDSRVFFDNVTGALTDNFEAYKAGDLSEGDKLGLNWTLPFLGYGDADIVAAAGAPPPDTTAPAPLIAKITAKGNAVAISGVSEVSSTVSLFDGARVVGTAVTDAGGAWSVNLSNLSKSIHVFSAEATDAAHNVGRSNLAYYGTSSADNIVGGANGDLIVAGGGNDFIWAGGGADTIAFGSGSGRDVIQDFHPGEDRIAILDKYGTFSQIQQAMRQDGGNTVIGSGGDTLTLWGVRPADLHAQDFLFG